VSKIDQLIDLEKLDVTYAQIGELVSVMRQAGASIESVLLTLRSEGASQATCIRVLIETEGGSLREWKRIVDSSQAWADRRESTDAFRIQLLQAVDTVEGEEPKSDSSR